jgi:hypothetical protein
MNAANSSDDVVLVTAATGRHGVARVREAFVGEATGAADSP